ERAWTAMFGGSSDVITRHVTLDRVPRRVVGVLPKAFTIFPECDFVLPLRLDGPDSYDENSRTLAVFARLKPGIDPGAAAWQINGLFRSLEPPQIGQVERLSDRLVLGYRPTLRVLWATTGFIILICALNFSSLLVARSTFRSQELIVRV